jgi:cell shape-determining protein MreC
MALRFSYREQSAKTGRRRLLAMTLLALLIVLFNMISGGSVTALVRGVTARVSLDAQAIMENVLGRGYFVSHATLAAQNESLQAQVATLTERVALSDTLSAEVATLAELAHLATSTRGITAPIASSFISSPYGTFLIGAGSAEGVSNGSIVLSSGGTALGRVASVSAHAATVVELFASGHSLNVLIDGAAITAHGVGLGNATAAVPHGVKVSVGDVVTAPELQGRPVGVVGHVDADTSSATTQTYIGLPVNLSALKYVYIVPATQ